MYIYAGAHVQLTYITIDDLQALLSPKAYAHSCFFNISQFVVPFFAELTFLNIP
jgi:hypothetical protein